MVAMWTKEKSMRAVIGAVLVMPFVIIYIMKTNVVEDYFMPLPMDQNYNANALMTLLMNGNHDTTKRGVKDTLMPLPMNGNYKTRNAGVTDTVTPIQVDKNMPVEKSRFAICSSYWEQQINALYNIWSFQKWANFTRFRVPEPFVSISTLGLAFVNQTLYHDNFTNALKFSDYFDLDFWTKKTKDYGIPPFVSWKTFVLLPIKKTVVVSLIYIDNHTGIYIGDNITSHKGCFESHNTFHKTHAKLFDQLQIQVVRNVCFAFKNSGFSLTLNQFNFAVMTESDVNIWFSSWHGIRLDRISLKDHEELRRTYDGRDEIQAMVKPSPVILRDSRKYVNTILKTEFNEYTAVAFRVGNRRAILVGNGYSRKDVMLYFQKCAEDVKRVLQKNPSNPVVLSSDLGRFGDQTFGFYFGVNNTGTKLLKFILESVYGNKSIDDYENEFMRAANGIEDTGYIGSMQKTIAENAKHLIVVGGYSNFQDSIVRHFKAKHQNCKDCLTCICYAGPLMSTAIKEKKPYTDLCKQH